MIDPEISILTNGVRKLVNSEAPMVVMTSHDGEQQFARISVRERYFVFPTYLDTVSEQRVQVFEYIGGVQFLLDSYGLSEVQEIVVTQDIAKQLEKILCLE